MQPSDNIAQALFFLVRSALGLPCTTEGPGVPDGSAPDWNTFTEADWQAILDLARKQTVTGLLFRGVAKLPAEVQVPDSLVFPLMQEADKVRKQSRLVARTAAEVVSFFEGRSLHPIILKGPSVAAFYPEPDLRESGDIDVFFIEKEFGKSVHCIRERLQKEGLSESLTILPDGSVHYKWNGIDIDQHTKYFDLPDAETLPPVPSPEATLLMLSAHILKHCMGAGIGLRQICDIAMAYQTLPYDHNRLLLCYESTETGEWNKLLASFLIRYLCVSRTPYTAEDAGLPDPEPLLKIILSGGNFGLHEATREKAMQGSPLQRKLDTARRFLGRLPFSLKYAPRQLVSYLKELTQGNFSHKKGSES